jgi:hypothetical protein
VRKGLLYVGTENALYASLDDGENWIPLQSNMPHAPVHWMVVQEHFNDLVVATYGRGFWIMDDITPLQQLTKEVIESDAHLFIPRPAYRFRFKSTPMDSMQEPSLGQNPSYGAAINYYLKERAKGKVSIEIFDETGEKVKSLNGVNKAGINRINWNLRYDLSESIKLRTKPKYADWVKVGKSGYRSYVSWGGPVSLFAPPGKYTVKLVVGDQEFTQELEVRRDPNAPGSEEGARQQFEMLKGIWADSQAVAEMVNQIEWIRKQIHDLHDMLKEKEEGKESVEQVTKAGKDLDEKLIGVEENLVQQKLTGGSQDILRWPMKMYGKVSMLAGAVASGDFPPTDQSSEVHAMYRKMIADYQAQLKDILEKDIPRYNELLAQNELEGIVTQIK